MLKSKIHRGRVTGSDLHYAGSITVDADLLEAADVREHEMVHVLDVDNGARFETYTIAGARGSGEMQVNGAAARLVHTGDTVIVVSYASYDERELESYSPRVVHVNEDNHIVTVDDAVDLASMPKSSDNDAEDLASMPKSSDNDAEDLASMPKSSRPMAELLS